MDRRLPVLLVALLALALSACNGDDTGTVTTTTGGSATSSSSSSSSLPGPTTTVTLPGAGTTPTSVPGLGPEQVAFLTDVRVARHAGFDRVVFEFEGDTVPPAEVEYVERPIREDASGNVVEVEGEAVLQVRMFPASGVDLSGQDFRQTYTGPTRITPSDTAVVEEVVRTGDFEAVLTWVVGVAEEAPFLVTTLADPSRLVIDIQG